MPRPVNKAELFHLSRKNFDKLMIFIHSVPENMRNAEFELNGRDKTIRDVICHLHEWHLMMMDWYRVGMSGGKPAMPGVGYTWQTLPALNRKIWEKYQQTNFAAAMSLIKESHQGIMELIEKHSDEELFTKKRYAWTGSTSLGSYFISATSSHYDWGLKTLKPIKKHLK